MNWFKAVLISLDQLINSLLGGYPDETISSVVWRWHMEGVRSWPKRIIDTIFSPWEKKHCYKSYLAEQRKLQQPPELRDGD